jgi:hypothetical protein
MVSHQTHSCNWWNTGGYGFFAYLPVNGLMVISSINSMAQASLAKLAFLAVVILAVGNTTGRIAAGIISDRMGR